VLSTKLVLYEDKIEQTNLFGSRELYQHEIKGYRRRIVKNATMIDLLPHRPEQKRSRYPGSMRMMHSSSNGSTSFVIWMKSTSWQPLKRSNKMSVLAQHQKSAVPELKAGAKCLM